MTPVLRAELKALGVDLAAIPPAIPAELMTQVIRKTAAALYPTEASAQAERRLGVVFMNGFSQTLLGAAMAQLMKVIGPRRSLERMQRNFRTGSNFIETKLTVIDERTFTLWFNDVCEVPEFYAGIIEQGGRTAGADGVSVEATPEAGRACSYRVSWSA